MGGVPSPRLQPNISESPFITFARDRPGGEGEAVDFGVVPHINRKLRVKIKPVDGCSLRMRESEGPELARESLWVGNFSLHHERGLLRAARAKADEGATRHARMAAENLFAWLGEERAGSGLDSFGLAATKPDAAGGIEIAAVAHAMPDRA